MKCGLGIRPELFAPVENLRPDFGFLEAHSENYFGESIARTKLLQLRRDYPVSLHGVGLSLGRADDLDREHLTQLKRLADEIEPLFVSEHLSWSAYAHCHVPDLLPLPLTEQALAIMCDHVDQMQESLGRRILVENPSNYLLFDRLQIPEPEFLNTLAERTGCGLLLDVNNVHVSATNLQRNSQDYIDALDPSAIGQYHLAGYTEVQQSIGGLEETVLIDTHNQPVHAPVWNLFAHTLEQHGARPTLLEWDADFPDFAVLQAQCEQTDEQLAGYSMTHIGAPSQRAEPPAANGDLARDQQEFLDALLQDGSVTSTIVGYTHRIQVYRNNVNAAIQDYLEHVYPATCGVVGADFFRQMVRAYLASHAPESGDIHRYGGDFYSIIKEFEGLRELYYLPDLMEYEWALHRAYYSSLAACLEIEKMEQERLLTLPVTLNKSVKLLRSTYPVMEIHRQSMPDYEGEVSINLGQSQDIILVHKAEHRVETHRLKDHHADLIEKITQSENLLQAIEALQGSLSAEQLSEALTRVFDWRLLADAT